MNRGKFITFEGGEGAGKSTHIALLAAELRARGKEVLVTREPGGTPIGEAIRALLQQGADTDSPVPRAELLLFCASRAQLVERVICPALAKGVWVLCDRYEDSTLAYQGAGRGFDMDVARSMSRFATNNLMPDMTLLLDLPPEVGIARVSTRGTRDLIESESMAFHKRLRDCFLELASAEKQRFVVVNMDRPKDVVADEILATVLERMKV